MMKSNHLTKQKRISIGKWKARNPNATFYETAELFNCTYYQARKAYNDYVSGKLTFKKPKFKNIEVESLVQSKSYDEILESQYHKAIAALEVTDKISVEERVKLLDTLFSMRKTLQQLKLESHIKRADAGVIKMLVLKYEPSASDDDVVKIYMEAVERWRLENKK